MESERVGVHITPTDTLCPICGEGTLVGHVEDAAVE